MEDCDYHTLRRSHHGYFVQLADEAWNLVQRLAMLRDDEQAQNIPFTTPQLDRFYRISDRAERRWQRRRDVMYLFGIDEQQMQTLEIGDRVCWRGQTLTIIDWHCHRDPVHGPRGHRLWAEPIFKNEKGQPTYIAPIYWHEMHCE